MTFCMDALCHEAEKISQRRTVITEIKHMRCRVYLDLDTAKVEQHVLEINMFYHVMLKFFLAFCDP